MQPTAYPHINDLLETFIADLQAILGDKLLGVYLYGSLVAGDYDDEISDIDLLVALRDDLTPTEYDALDRMHHDIVARDSRWDNRIEVAYVTHYALQTFKTERRDLAVISPGEPFHYKSAGIDWLINWHVVREKGVVLYGVPATDLIASTTQAEYVQKVRDHADSWGEWIHEPMDLPFQSYSILTLCRALYTVKHGVQPSKVQAAEWAIEQFPQWTTTIENALIWRKQHDAVDPTTTADNTRRFVLFIREKTIEDA